MLHLQNRQSGSSKTFCLENQKGFQGSFLAEKWVWKIMSLHNHNTLYLLPVRMTPLWIGPLSTQPPDNDGRWNLYCKKTNSQLCFNQCWKTMRIWSKTSRWSILKVVYPLENLRSARIVQVVWFHVGRFAQWPTKHRDDGFVVDKFTEKLFSFEKKNVATQSLLHFSKA